MVHIQNYTHELVNILETYRYREPKERRGGSRLEGTRVKCWMFTGDSIAKQYTVLQHLCKWIQFNNNAREEW